MSMYFKLVHSWFWLKVRYTFFRLKVYHKLEIWHFLFSITCISIIKIKCCIVNQLVSYFELNSQKGTHQIVALFWIRRFLSIGSDKSVLHWSQWEGRGQHSTDQLMSSESKYPGGQCGEWPDMWCERTRPDSDLVWHCDTTHSHITQTPGIGQQWDEGGTHDAPVYCDTNVPGPASWAEHLISVCRDTRTCITRSIIHVAQ